jgi:hypothetical protein
MDGGIGLLIILFITYLFVGLASMLCVMHTTIKKSWEGVNNMGEKKKFNPISMVII